MTRIVLPILLLTALLITPGAAYADEPDVDLLHEEFAALAGGGPAWDEADYVTGDPGTVDRDYRYVNHITSRSNYTKGRRGILVIGRRDTVRAVEPFNSVPERLDGYADAVNRYAELFPDVKIYCMPVPTSAAYYIPDAAMPAGGDATRPAMLHLFDRLDPRVQPVDIYPTLGDRADRAIYSRTDHHWAPLGAWYAAAAFAQVAGVPFAPAEAYDTCRVEGYVGTMAGFARSEAVRRSPEVFEYYTPKRDDYETTYIIYNLDKARVNVTSESEPAPGSFFKTTARGSATYLVFMGGDSRLTKVVTHGPEGRRLLILKDSFGNAVPGYLFDSFEQIHVADCRYFTPDIVEYITSNGITDILFVNNMAHIVNPRTAARYLEYLTRHTANASADDEATATD